MSFKKVTQQVLDLANMARNTTCNTSYVHKEEHLYIELLTSSVVTAGAPDMSVACLEFPRRLSGGAEGAQRRRGEPWGDDHQLWRRQELLLTRRPSREDDLGAAVVVHRFHLLDVGGCMNE